MGLISCDIWFEAPGEFSHCLLTHLVQTAPSQVSGVMKERVLQRSVELSWQEPEHPNGVITEYEIKYYEKVSVREPWCGQSHARCQLTALHTSAGHCPAFGATPGSGLTISNHLYRLWFMTESKISICQLLVSHKWGYYICSGFLEIFFNYSIKNALMTQKVINPIRLGKCPLSVDLFT